MSDDAGEVWEDVERASGPWNVGDAPHDVEYVDFGAIRVPVLAGSRARVEVAADTGRVAAVTMRVDDCAVQAQAYACDATTGNWDESRQELVAHIRAIPGLAHVVEGHFGPEVIAVVPARQRDGSVHDVTMRFVGVQGDDWLLRVSVTGPTVTRDATVRHVDAFLSRLVIDASHRVPPGSPLELRLPAGGEDA